MPNKHATEAGLNVQIEILTGFPWRIEGIITHLSLYGTTLNPHNSANLGFYEFLMKKAGFQGYFSGFTVEIN